MVSMKENYKYKQNDVVHFKLGNISGYAKVVGCATIPIPFIGRMYIVEPIDSTEIPNETYPFTTITVSENSITIVKPEKKYFNILTYGNYKNAVCEEKDCDCMFTRECANHSTAGQFREEGGMSPDIRLQNNKLQCTKSDTGRNDGFVVLKY